jgi:hypothetical protein
LAQSAGHPKHPNDPNAVPVGTFGLTVNTSEAPNSKAPSPFSDAVGSISVIITVFNIGGHTDYYIDPNAVTFTGDGAWVDSRSTGQIFDLISQTALSQGLALGYATCESNCGLVNLTTRVYAPACVKRSGQGLDTHFDPCSLSAFSLREYVVCCPNGIEAPVTDLVFKLNGGLCFGENCHATCP